MPSPLICVRIPLELRAQLEAICKDNSVSISDWLRALIVHALAGQGLGESEGFGEARRFGLLVARRVIDHALAEFPASYEEALARFGDTSGRIG